MPGNFKIRTMARCEIPLAIDAVAREGWNPGWHDAETFFAADPNGFFTGELDGKPAATISAVAYGKNFGFVGLYIVKPEFRKQGHGLRIWNQALDYLANRNIGLDAVVEQQKTYERSGFKKSYANIRYGMTADLAAVNETIPLAAIPFEQVLAYDTALFPAPRPEFLKSWIAQPQAVALAVMAGGKPGGFGILRPCRSGHKIGPLFANDKPTAEILFRDLLSRIPGEPVFLDVPEVNSDAVALAEGQGMKKVFETGRMYTRETPDLPMNQIFGVTTFELG